VAPAGCACLLSQGTMFLLLISQPLGDYSLSVVVRVATEDKRG